MKIIRDDPARKVPLICEKDALSYVVLELKDPHSHYIAVIRKVNNDWEVAGGRFWPEGPIVRWSISSCLDGNSFLEVLIKLFQEYQDGWECTIYILDNWQEVVKLLGRYYERN
jgi:hypothetical protein